MACRSHLKLPHVTAIGSVALRIFFCVASPSSRATQTGAMLLLDHDFGVAFGTPKYQTIASAMSELRQAYSDAAYRAARVCIQPDANAFR